MATKIKWPTQKELIAWAESLPPDTIVGEAGVCENCVLSRYMHEQYPDLYFWINPGEIDQTYACGPVPYAHENKPRYSERKRLPARPNAIGRKFDRLFECYDHVRASTFAKGFKEVKG